MQFEWVNFFQFVFVALAFLLAGLTLGNQSTRLLAVFFIVIGIHGAFSRLPFAAGTVLDEYSYALAFAYAPLIYLAIKSLLRKYNLDTFGALLVLAAMITGVIILALGYADTTVPGIMLTAIQFVAVYAGFLELSSYKSTIEQSRASSVASAVAWVRSALILYLAIAALQVVRFVLAGSVPNPVMSVLDVFVAVGIASTLAVIALKVVSDPEWMPRVSVPERELAVQVAKADKQATEEQRRLANELDVYLQSEKPYLDPEITVRKLAEQLGWPARQLSEVINSVDNVSFSQKINRLRVDEAKAQMADPCASGKPLLNIALDSGFNSKSAFNLMFKRFAGVTPTQYRRNITDKAS